LNILVLSPHRDDAAFSLSLSIAHWLAVGHRVTILNVFTRSLYAPYSDAESVHENDRLSWVSAMRKREDEAFLKQVPGASMIDLNIKDAPIRLHCDASIVCDMDVDPNDSALPKIRKAVARQLETPHALVIPLGLGHHVDHRVVRDAVLPLTPDRPCAFYEELPYATRDGVRVDLSRFREDTEHRFHEDLHPVLCHGTHTRPAEHKRRIALLYSSQIDAELADTIANFSHRYHGAERMWANQAWLDLASASNLSTRQRDEEALPLPA
jgi:LmbE family N-acetylglucosaminyl deacetylase